MTGLGKSFLIIAVRETDLLSEKCNNPAEPLYQPSHMLGYGNIFGGKF